ncbi:MAG: hypothetical protein WEA34_08245 [Gemmatimonadota bacterium]
MPPKIDFKRASDRAAAARITLADMAKSVGVEHQTLRRARMDPESSGYRGPPEGWEKALAKLAQKRASDLIKLAEELRRAAERR